MKDYKAEIEKELKENCSNNLLREKKYLIEQLQAKDKVIDRAYKVLNGYGVPKQRAKSVSNGIQVLVSRMDKEIWFLQQEIGRLKEKLKFPAVHDVKEFYKDE